MNAVKTSLLITLAISANLQASETSLEETTTIADQLFRDTSIISPSSTISSEELQSINLLTSEDAVAYEPSLVVRRRYVGDPNGTIGIRGAGMFQTARSLVFADGLPLHYLLQTRWSGAPRWSLVGANEIASAQVIYGPYSAEYSGNAMGGVVNIETKTPKKRQFNIQGTLINQQYDVLATDKNYNGGKLYLSYEDKVGDLSLFTSYSRLDNVSQPMSNYYVNASERTTLQDNGVKGYIPSKDDRGNDVLIIGDSGGERALSELYKIKLAYQFSNTQLRAVAAFEDRLRELENLNNYLRNPDDSPHWGIGNRNFQQRHQQRQSLLLGVGVSGRLSEAWHYDIYLTNFEILKDKEIRSGRNPNDPSYVAQNQKFRGRLTEHGNTAWYTADIKIGNDSLFNNDNMRLSIGYHQDRYELEIKPYNFNAISNTVGSARDASGGKTETKALFAQWGLTVNSQWDLALGVRYEDWQSKDGFLGGQYHQNRDEDGLSPKFSLAYQATDSISIRYSAAKALRFPITEELYSNESRTSTIMVSDPSLAPEAGIHHNLSIEKLLDKGSFRINVFLDRVKDSIYNQRGSVIDGGTLINVSTFLAIDEVTTRGVELIYNQANILDSKFSLRFNSSYTHAEITANSVNRNIEGNNMPRIPTWRAKLILSYAVHPTINLNTSIRYASNSHGDLDNADNTSSVYGAIDSYLFVNAKANWHVNKNTDISLGVDNIFNKLAYVAHPWPSRTLYLEGRYHF